MAPLCPQLKFNEIFYVRGTRCRFSLISRYFPLLILLYDSICPVLSRSRVSSVSIEPEFSFFFSNLSLEILSIYLLMLRVSAARIGLARLRSCRILFFKGLKGFKVLMLSIFSWIMSNSSIVVEMLSFLKNYYIYFLLIIFLGIIKFT